MVHGQRFDHVKKRHMTRLRKILGMIMANSLAGIYWLPRPLRLRLYRASGITVGRGVYIFPGQMIRPGPLHIGDRVFVNGRCTFEPGDAGIVLESDVFLAQNVVITATTHEVGPPAKRAGRTISCKVVVGRGSWVGTAVVILPGVTIAPGCVIAAGAVVTRDTAPDGLYMGVPAKRVRSLPT